MGEPVRSCETLSPFPSSRIFRSHNQTAVPLAFDLTWAQHHWYGSRPNEAQSHGRRVARRQ